jgi:hypothetical protein
LVERNLRVTDAGVIQDFEDVSRVLERLPAIGEGFKNANAERPKV